MPDDSTDAPVAAAAILRARWGQLPLEPFAQILVDLAGLVKADATAACAHGRGILVQGIPEAAAHETVAALKSHGEEAWVVAEQSLAPRLPWRQVHSAHFGHAGARFVDAAGHAEEVQWSDALALAFARVRLHDSSSGIKPKSPLMRDGFGAAMAVGVGGVMVVNSDDFRPPVTAPRTGQVRTFVEMVFAGHPHRLRIDGHEFDYSILGDQLQPGADANIQTLARWLLHAAPHMRTNVDSQALIQTGRVRLTEVHEHLIDDLMQWLANLAQVR